MPDRPTPAEVAAISQDYDEDRELTRYIWDFFQSHMSDFEQRVGLAIIGRMKADSSSSPNMASVLNERWGKLGDPELDAALANGHEAFRRKVRERVLAEHGEKIVVNRCPQCHCVVRTPQAKQCFWCGQDWHEVDS